MVDLTNYGETVIYEGQFGKFIDLISPICDLSICFRSTCFVRYSCGRGFWHPPYMYVCII